MPMNGYRQNWGERVEITFWPPDLSAKNVLLHKALDLLNEDALVLFLGIIKLCIFCVFEEQQDQ